MFFHPLSYVDRLAAAEQDFAPARRHGERVAEAIHRGKRDEVALGTLERLGDLLLGERGGAVDLGLKRVEPADLGDELRFLLLATLGRLIWLRPIRRS